MNIGILALQGDYEAHALVLKKLDVDFTFIKLPEQFNAVDGLIIPGGESTTLLRFMENTEFFAAIKHMAAANKPIFGTCAGAILLATEVSHPHQPSLGLIDVAINRNAYGRQVHSHIKTGQCLLTHKPMEMVFIRAPRITHVGETVKILATLHNEAVAAQQGRCLIATFHPELTDDLTLHRHFIKL